MGSATVYNKNIGFLALDKKTSKTLIS